MWYLAGTLLSAEGHGVAVIPQAPRREAYRWTAETARTSAAATGPSSRRLLLGSCCLVDRTV